MLNILRNGKLSKCLCISISSWSIIFRVVLDIDLTQIFLHMLMQNFSYIINCNSFSNSLMLGSSSKAKRQVVHAFKSTSQTFYLQKQHDVIFLKSIYSAHVHYGKNKQKKKFYVHLRNVYERKENGWSKNNQTLFLL